MIKATVDTLDGRALAREIRARAEEGARDGAAELVREHRSAIRGAEAPSGGAQQQNAPAVRRRKGGRPPLYDTGRLLSGTRVVSRSDGAQVVPPADRRDVVESLHERGYHTIWSLSDDDAAEIVDGDVRESVRRTDVRKHVTRRRS